MIIEINIFLCEQLISMFIMGCPEGKINMADVSAKRSMIYASCVNIMCILSQTKINFSNFSVNLWVISFMVYAFHRMATTFLQFGVFRAVFN